MKGLTLILAMSLGFQAAAAGYQRLSAFDEGKRDFESGRYGRALSMLATAINQAPSATARNKAYYYQGLVLFELGHYYSSYVSFRNVLLTADDRNREIYEKAIKNAVIITDRLDMVDRVGKALEKLPPSFIPYSVGALANYAMGVAYFTDGQNEKAAGLLKSVNPESQFYPKAQFYLGVLATKQKNYRDAIYYFQKVVEVSHGKRDLLQLSELSRLDLARSLYSSGDIEQSIETYAQFLSSSRYWLTVLLEASWPLMRVNDTTVSLGNLHTVLSPFYREDLVGEAYILRATILFSLCKYEEMRRTLSLFFTLYDPVVHAMQAEQDSIGGPQAYYDAYVSGKGLNVSFRNFVRRDAGITNQLKVLKMLRDERRSIARYRRNEQMRRMATIIDDSDHALSLQIGATLQSLHKRKLADLLEQREQANYLRVEIVTGEKELIENQKGLPPKRVMDVETSVSKGFQFWPFVGEYWDDELGAYVYLTESACVN